MTNQEIKAIALQQSAWELHCQPEDFLADSSRVVVSTPDTRARAYLQLPFDCQLVSYGDGIVASVRPELVEPVRAYVETYPALHCFETPHLHVLEETVAAYGLRICFMAEYFLPDVQRLSPRPCPYELRVLGPDAFAGRYTDAWSNALCEKRKHLDVLGVGAFDGETLAGLAACSADCASMWQIGVDVLPNYRRQGIASACTSTLAAEILARGKVPFYCAAWSNIKSVRNAIASGFRPAWVEMAAKSRRQVEDMNRPRANA